MTYFNCDDCGKSLTEAEVKASDWSIAEVRSWIPDANVRRLCNACTQHAWEEENAE